MSYRLQQSLSERCCVVRYTPSKRSEPTPPFSFSTTIYSYAETGCDFVSRRRRVTAHLEGVRYYGYRYYNPDLGRWINRDPIGEAGGMNIFSFVSNAPVNIIDLHGLSPGDMLWPSPIEIGLQAWWDLLNGFHSEEGCKIVEDETAPEKQHGNSKSMHKEICTNSIESGDFYYWCSDWIEDPETPPIVSNLQIYSHAGNAVRTWTEYRHETSSCYHEHCECECRPGDWIWKCEPAGLMTIGRNQEYKCWRIFELNGKYPRKTPPWFPITI